MRFLLLEEYIYVYNRAKYTHFLMLQEYINCARYTGQLLQKFYALRRTRSTQLSTLVRKGPFKYSMPDAAFCTHILENLSTSMSLLRAACAPVN